MRRNGAGDDVSAAEPTQLLLQDCVMWVSMFRRVVEAGDNMRDEKPELSPCAHFANAAKKLLSRPARPVLNRRISSGSGLSVRLVTCA